MDLLTVNNICKQERGETILHPISFTMPAGGKLAIAGETGSGKTTLLKIVGGLTQASSGTALLQGEKILGPDERLIPGHPRIAYLSQHFELRNNYRVEEELESKNLLEEEEAQNIYAVCQINHLLKRKTTELSGGERQRIVLARLLTTQPQLLLLDEPFSNLDAPHKLIIKNVLNEVHTKLGIGIIMVSHEAADILPWAKRLFILKAGKLVQQGSCKELYAFPANEYCAALLGNYNLLDAATAAQLLPDSNVKFKKNKIIIRPEHILIDSKGLPCIITNMEYFGSYYLLYAKHSTGIINVRINTNTHNIGDRIFLKTMPAQLKPLLQ
ncbi:MAG: hypothetical protein RIR12_4 [Bacteroidota bacterium]|jgi:iron(III) transport system ATP-binding protein